MKAILMSIHPKWCEKIFDGSKSIEVRKSRPSIPTPFTVYVYQTKHNGGKAIVSEVLNNVYGGGKVIGSFVCDWITEVIPHCDVGGHVNSYVHGYPAILGDDCLSFKQLKAYLGNKRGYDWHITEPKLFDKPRALGEFLTPSGTGGVWGNHYLSRPPQSWCYVEEEG